MKLKIEKDGNDSLSIEHKEEIYIFHKSMDLLISNILNNNSEGVELMEIFHWQVRVSKIAEQVGKCYGSCHAINTDDLQFHKMYATWSLTFWHRSEVVRLGGLSEIYSKVCERSWCIFVLDHHLPWNMSPLLHSWIETSQYGGAEERGSSLRKSKTRWLADKVLSFF